MLKFLEKASGQLASRTKAAASEWQRLVMTAASGKGKQPTLEELEAAGQAFGLTGGNVIAAFHSDVEATGNILADEKKLADATRRLDGMDVVELQRQEQAAEEKLRLIRREVSEHKVLAYHVGTSGGSLEREKAALPRVYPELHALHHPPVQAVQTVTLAGNDAEWLPADSVVEVS